jgi:hypothetical protein
MRTRKSVIEFSRGMFASPRSTRSAMTERALRAWPHSARTIFLTLSFLAASACLRGKLDVVIPQSIVDGINFDEVPHHDVG